jgi:hypothetical protein
MRQITMLGKIIVISLIGLAFIAYTGINATQYYQDFVMIRDKAQPMADNLIEKVLGEASHYDLKSTIVQLTGGKIG